MKRTKIDNEQTFVLQNEEYSGSIIPLKKSEMWREIKLFGNVHITGSIFGKLLEIDSNNVLVEKSVYCKESIVIKGKVWFNSPVSADSSLLVNENSKVRFSSDIHSSMIHLKNSIVYGNIFCDEIILDKSVVLGSVFSKNKIDVSNSIIGSYDTKNIIMNGKIGQLLAVGISDEEPIINGKVYNVFTADYQTGSNEIDAYELTKDDIFKVSINENGENKYLFSPNMRIFDLRKYEKAIKENLLKIIKYTNVKIEDHVQIDKELSIFDRIFFNFINEKIEGKMNKTYSDFINIKNDVLEKYVQETQ